MGLQFRKRRKNSSTARVSNFLFIVVGGIAPTKFDSEGNQAVLEMALDGCSGPDNGAHALGLRKRFE